MSKLTYLMALPVIPGVIAFASIETGVTTAGDQAKSRTGVQCEVRVARIPGGIELEAVASADRNLTGEYEFVIEKRGSGGSSSIVQGGEFSLARRQEQVLGSAGLNLDRRGSYSARLSLEGARGVLCTAEESK